MKKMFLSCAISLLALCVGCAPTTSTAPPPYMEAGTVVAGQVFSSLDPAELAVNRATGEVTLSNPASSDVLSAAIFLYGGDDLAVTVGAVTCTPKTPRLPPRPCWGVRGGVGIDAGQVAAYRQYRLKTVGVRSGNASFYRLGQLRYEALR